MTPSKPFEQKGKATAALLAKISSIANVAGTTHRHLENFLKEREETFFKKFPRYTKL
jgi:hypothetical protein